MQDWKLSPLPIVMLRGWAYHQAPPPQTTSKPRRPRRSVVRRGAAIISGLLTTSWRRRSGEAFPQRDRGDLDPG
jgi:hypothetical protein